jgi:zinc finger protein|tara:strand:- start:402 stop:983 length:582 start_codon:yes stop_codon:yes gene_type:complete
MQSKVDAPCPECLEDDALIMLAMSSEIPYFGEHTQITVICESCGWKHTDFIPSDGEKPGYSSLIVDNTEKCSARVVRSSACTIRIPELDLEVSPGGSSSGFVSNIEGVINRFEDAVGSIIRGSAEDETVLDASLELLEGLRKMKNGESEFLIELLDPRGRSQIIHDEATIRELMENEKQSLDMGPEVPVFDLS